MKFIERISALAKKEDNKGLRALLEELAHDPSISSSQFKKLFPEIETENFYLFFSEGEAAFILIDTDGKTDELADEEEFEEEEPLWFTEHGHRVSPFFRIKTLSKGFLKALGFYGESEIEDYICVVISNTHIVNFDEVWDIYDKSKGAVFHSVEKLSTDLSVNNSGKAQELVEEFKNRCLASEELLALFVHPNEVVDTPPQSEESSTSLENLMECGPVQINDIISKMDVNDLVDQRDTDFISTEEVVNAETGESFTLRKDTDFPAVTILKPIINPRPFLDEMVGLHNLKKNINEIVAYAKYSKKVREIFPTLEHAPINLHTIIVGNPGTGKTTMCRIYGGLLHSAGILSSGHTVVTTRSTFLGQYFGVVEKRVNQCLKLAQGGCLFIDEAAQLFNNAHPYDPGRNVLQLMLQLLAEEDNRDIAVVLALYANDKSLERLYELNPGIKSRFVNVLKFPDYSLEELIEIAEVKAKAQCLTFTPKAWQKFCAIISQIYETRDRNFANGREVMNLLQRCVIKLAIRCEKNGLTDRDLLRLTVHDIPDLPAPTITTRKLGFH